MEPQTINDSVEMHSIIAKDYAKNLTMEESHQYAHEISKILPIKRGDVILDVGAGSGRITKAILEDHPYIKTYYALEPSKLADYFMVNDDRVELFRCLGQDIPLSDNMCDLSFASEVFCHLKETQDQIDILREMQRVTKIGGFVCILTTPINDTIISLYARIFRRPREHYFKPQSKPDENGRDVFFYRRRYLMGEVKSLLRNSNLTLIRMIPGHKKFGPFNVYLHVIAQKRESPSCRDSL